MAAETTPCLLEARLSALKPQGRPYCLTLTVDSVCWSEESKKTRETIKIADVLTARLIEQNEGSSSYQSEEETSSSCFTIHYVKHKQRKKAHTLSRQSIKFYGPEETCKEWVDTIQKHLRDKLPQRPKNLLIFINPVSGKKAAPKVYRSRAQPLFTLCGVTTDVVITARAHHTEEFIKSYDLSKIDGIVTVGGDGTYAEAITGLLRRSMAEANVDENNPNAAFTPVSIPVGLIPSGTGDGIVDAANTTKDVTTAILLIILGGRIPKDVCTVHEGRQLVTYSVLLSGTGLFAEIIRKAENNRQLGRARYLYGSLYGLAKHRVVHVQVDYCPVQHNPVSSEIAEGEPMTDGGSESPPLAQGWLRRSAHFVRVDHFSFPIVSRSTPVQECMGDGTMCLNFVQSCGRISHLNYIRKWITNNPSAQNCSFAQEVDVMAYKVRPLGDWRNNPLCQYLNVDGEIVHLPAPDYSIRAHKGLSQLYSWDLQDITIGKCAGGSQEWAQYTERPDTEGGNVPPVTVPAAAGEDSTAKSTNIPDERPTQDSTLKNLDQGATGEPTSGLTNPSVTPVNSDTEMSASFISKAEREEITDSIPRGNSDASPGDKSDSEPWDNLEIRQNVDPSPLNNSDLSPKNNSDQRPKDHLNPTDNSDLCPRDNSESRAISEQVDDISVSIVPAVVDSGPVPNQENID